MGNNNLDSQEIVVVCSASDEYAMPMTVTIFSALSNLRSRASRILLFIFDGGIKEPTKRKIEQSLQSNQLEINWIKIDPIKFKNLPTKHLALPAYYRLAMAEILPKQYTKAIYLDSDMVVLGDLQELWNIDLEDKYLLAVRDGFEISSAPGLSNYKELGLRPDAMYFNAGLLVVNLQKWREDHIEVKTLKFLNENRATIKQLDQDALNAVLIDKWKEIDPRWNQLSQLYLIPVEAGFFDSPEIHRAVLNDPLIIHYSGSKPWRISCNHPRVDRFEKYLDQTAWAGTRDNQWKRFVRQFQWKSIVRQFKMRLA